MDKHLEERLKAIEEQLQAFQQAMEGMGRDLRRPVSAVRDGYYEAALTNAGAIIEAMLRDVWVREKITGKADAKTIEQLFNVVKEQAQMDRIVVNYVRDIQLVRNRAAHGEQIVVEDCIECLRKLAVVLDWYFKKYVASSLPGSPASGSLAPAPRRHAGARWLAAGAAAVILAVCGWLIWRHQGTRKEAKAPSQPAPPQAASPARPQNLVILVAPFWGQSPQALEEGRVMQALVERKLQETLSQEPDVTILGKNVREVPKSLAEARELARRLGAQSAVWGEVLVLGKEMEVKYYVLNDVYGQKRSTAVSFYNDLSAPGRLVASEKKAEEVGNLALFTASFFYRARGDREKAIVLLKRISPQTVQSLVTQANCYANLGKWDAAENALAEAMKLDPKSASPHIQRAVLMEKQHKLEEALGEAQKAVALEPGRSGCYDMLGTMHFERQEYDEAVEALKKAIEIEPENGDAQGLLAQVYRRENKLELAVQSARRAVAIEPEYPGWHGLLAELYLDQGKTGDALAEYKMAVEFDPTLSRYVIAYAQTLRSVGKDKEAVELFEKVIASGHDDTWNHIWLYIVEAKAAGAQTARARIKGYAATLKGSDWIDPVARFYAGEISEDALLEAAENPEPTRANRQKAEAHYYIGLQRLLDGDKAKARESFQKCVASGAKEIGEYKQAAKELAKLNTGK